MGMRISCCVLTVLMALAACAHRPHHRPAPVREGDATAAQLPRSRGGLDHAPDWANQPHSWGKLDAIERWLADASAARPGTSASGTSASGTAGYWLTEGQLQLAEGQLRFAEAGQGSGGASAEASNIILFRRDASIEGFEAVRTAPEATTNQRARASAGLRKSRAILRGVQSSTQPASTRRTPNVPVGGLVPRSAWSATRADAGNMRPSTATWKWITVHHSVFAPTTDKLSDSLDVVLRIQRQHVDVENYADIGYHYLIDRAGRVIEGRRLKWQGAHAGDSNKNRGNVGICLLGNFEEEHPTKSAIASLDKLVYELQSKLRIPRKNVRPHKAWKETACPGKHLMPWFTRF